MAARLMLVDDDQNILASVSVALEAEGFEVSTFFDSEMAMIELSRNPPDLAVLDIKMPKLTGTEMLKKIRTKSELPVIFLTSKDDEIDEAVGFELGADDYITKPFFTEIADSTYQCAIAAHLRGRDDRITEKPDQSGAS